MNTLKDLLVAMEAGEVTNVVAFLDNDNVSFYDGAESHLLSLHPHDVQMQALEALGIRGESV